MFLHKTSTLLGYACARTHTHTFSLYVCASLCLGYQFGSVNVQRKKTTTHEKKTKSCVPCKYFVLLHL